MSIELEKLPFSVQWWYHFYRNQKEDQKWCRDNLQYCPPHLRGMYRRHQRAKVAEVAKAINEAKEFNPFDGT